MIKWVAEIGSNHNNSRDRIELLIKTAKEIGCDAVKFQLFKAEKLWYDKKIAKKMKEWELQECLIPKIKQFCDKYEIKLGFSVFDLEAVDKVKDYVDFLKIGSYETYYGDLINKVLNVCDNKPMPMHISTGLLTNLETKELYDELTKFDDSEIVFVLYECNPNYPASLLNESKFKYLNEIIEFDVDCVGYSDHTRSQAEIYKAIALGTNYIEFHFDLNDMKGNESKSELNHVWSANNIKKVIDVVKTNKEKQIINFHELRQQRTDIDGMRPLKKYRKELCQNKE
jgi:N-acetylneuraminate synthase